MKYNFDVEKITNECIDWIREWFGKNGAGCNAVIGMSGGKDSTITAALCVKALGADRVIGVAMPDRNQSINEADEICKYLGIKYILADIGPACDGFRNLSIVDDGLAVNGMWSKQAEQNIPPRVRMAMLYAIAQTYNGRVSCNCNLSESYIGYETIFGDNVGAFSALRYLTVTEVKAIGRYLEIPSKWVDKIPDDGLPHSCSDEEKIGFLYSELDEVIREGKHNASVEMNKLLKIMNMHQNSQFKRNMINIPSYVPEITIW